MSIELPENNWTWGILMGENGMALLDEYKVIARDDGKKYLEGRRFYFSAEVEHVVDFVVLGFGVVERLEKHVKPVSLVWEELNNDY